MKLVTQTDELGKAFGEEKAVRIIGECGYDGVDLSFFGMISEDNVWNQDDYKQHAARLREIAVEYGMTFMQAHAPMPSSDLKEGFDEWILSKIHRAMEAAALLGIPYIIVHPKQHLPYRKNAQALYEMNIEFYKNLIPYCEAYGIHVCVENMFQTMPKSGYLTDSTCSRPEEFIATLDEVNSPWIVGCLDIGHAALVGEDPAEFIRALGRKRLKALHVHDVDYLHDCHTLPYMKNLDWDSIMTALADIGYEGALTFEADRFLDPYPPALKKDAAKLMERVGRHLIGIYEEAAGRKGKK